MSGTPETMDRARAVSIAVGHERALEREVVERAQHVAARQAWADLIADPTEENRAVFVAACERAR